MGNSTSTAASAAPSFSQFEAEVLMKLMKRFKKLDADCSGTLNNEEFMAVSEAKANPLAQRVIDLFDEDGDGEVNFEEFINTLALFSVKSDKLQKLRFAFRIYDLDNDGLISYDDLFNVLKIMVGKNLTDKQLGELCARQINYADVDDDGKISFEEFCRMVESMNVHDKMKVEL